MTIWGWEEFSGATNFPLHQPARLWLMQGTFTCQMACNTVDSIWQVTLCSFEMGFCEEYIPSVLYRLYMRSICCLSTCCQVVHNGWQVWRGGVDVQAAQDVWWHGKTCQAVLRWASWRHSPTTCQGQWLAFSLGWIFILFCFLVLF